MKPVFIAKSTDLAARMVGGEMMIMSARDSTLFSLNEVAAAIWNAADGVTPLSRIVETAVCAEFDVAPEKALADAESLVAGLAEHGVLIVSDQPVHPAAKSATQKGQAV